MTPICPRWGFRRLAALMALAILGCTSGPNVEEYTPAHSGSGILFEFRFDGRPTPRLFGELLAVERSTMLVVVHEAEPPIAEAPPTPYVARIARRAVRRAEFADRWRTRNIAESVSNRVRMSSRYPYGVTDDVLGRLLAAYGQESLVRYPPEEGER